MPLGFSKGVIGAIFVILGVGYGLQLEHLLQEVRWDLSPMRWFGTGFVVFLPMWVVYFRRADFWSTFEHELTHLLVGLLFLKKPRGFLVEARRGGAVVLHGGNFVITLAPYFLPTLVLLQLPLFLVIDGRFQWAAFGVMGWLFGFNLLCGLQEFSYRQPDIRKYGPVFSTVVILVGNLVCLGFILAFLQGGFGWGGWFLKGGILQVWELGTGFLQGLSRA